MTQFDYIETRQNLKKVHQAINDFDFTDLAIIKTNAISNKESKSVILLEDLVKFSKSNLEYNPEQEITDVNKWFKTIGDVAFYDALHNLNVMPFNLLFKHCLNINHNSIPLYSWMFP